MNLPGDLDRQYRAFSEAAALLDLSARGKVRVTGPDRISFLHAMISNDVEKLGEYEGRYATLLTAQGRIVADFTCYKLPEFVLIDLPPAAREAFVSTLERFIIMDDVTLHDETPDWAHFSLQGPSSPGILREMLGIEPPEAPLALQVFQFESVEGLAVSRATLHAAGFELLAPASSLRRLRASLTAHPEVVAVGEEAAEIRRVERGIPAFGAELGDSVYPMEAGLDSAISLTKGCFIGQEVVAKATHVGGVNRLLRRLRITGGAAPTPGAELSAEGKKAGMLTSIAPSPSGAGWIGLGFVRKAHSRAGAVLEVELSNAPPATAEVVGA